MGRLSGEAPCTSPPPLPFPGRSGNKADPDPGQLPPSSSPSRFSRSPRAWERARKRGVGLKPLRLQLCLQQLLFQFLDLACRDTRPGCFSYLLLLGASTLPRPDPQWLRAPPLSGTTCPMWGLPLQPQDSAPLLHASSSPHALYQAPPSIAGPAHLPRPRPVLALPIHGWPLSPGPAHLPGSAHSWLLPQSWPRPISLGPAP